ncbi:hypothetical protein LINGRAHAP2_LOCUS26284 [Linum grandiflorum]
MHVSGRRSSVQQQTRQSSNRQRKWEVSVDAAVNCATSSGVLGVVIRSGNDGSLFSATGLVIPHISDPLTLEVMAIRRALPQSMQRSQDQISILSDPAKAVRMVTSSMPAIRVSMLLQYRSMFFSLPLVTLSHIRHSALPI